MGIIAGVDNCQPREPSNQLEVDRKRFALFDNLLCGGFPEQCPSHRSVTQILGWGELVPLLTQALTMRRAARRKGWSSASTPGLC
jgi:hypothetical protein